jgi:hypothetical protein
MESLEYYRSIVVNPFREDDSRDQESAILAGEAQYRVDSISETIGTVECAYNIDLFLNDILKELDQDALYNFYNICMEKLITIYGLTTLEDLLIDRYSVNKPGLILTVLLGFFEKGDCSDLLARAIPADDYKFFMHDRETLLEYLDLYYNSFINNIKKLKNSIPKHVYYYLITGSKEDVFNTVVKLIMKYKTKIVENKIAIQTGVE